MPILLSPSHLATLPTVRCTQTVTKADSVFLTLSEVDAGGRGLAAVPFNSRLHDRS
ncbi:hypothetical protein IQ268_23035 [Oculatella sp. LEGE 06141]|uniref:hypothetical protein n=1 Tax=Oculatella sp. LEGE 06141 TaxID=1828648 RepID=UPI0018817524|nr:hypothetical protein [Oculatella sp. LEGE 06141]MBE9181442.1 hypothetical protein [Oculatella sp. LEGE 06141]